MFATGFFLLILMCVLEGFFKISEKLESGELILGGVVAVSLALMSLSVLIFAIVHLP